jgi:hypothetical protein
MAGGYIGKTAQLFEKLVCYRSVLLKFILIYCPIYTRKHRIAPELPLLMIMKQELGVVRAAGGFIGEFEKVY